MTGNKTVKRKISLALPNSSLNSPRYKCRKTKEISDILSQKQINNLPGTNVLIELILDYLDKNFDSQPSLEFSDGSGRFCISSPNYKIMLRNKPSGYDGKLLSLVVAVIQFTDKRKGHALNFLKFLTSLRDLFQWRYFHIECPNDQSRKFGENLGFKENFNGNLTVSNSKLRYKLFIHCTIKSVLDLLKKFSKR
jgi:hypothetical protein